MPSRPTTLSYNSFIIPDPSSSPYKTISTVWTPRLAVGHGAFRRTKRVVSSMSSMSRRAFDTTIFPPATWALTNVLTVLTRTHPPTCENLLRDGLYRSLYHFSLAALALFTTQCRAHCIVARPILWSCLCLAPPSAPWALRSYLSLSTAKATELPMICPATGAGPLFHDHFRAFRSRTTPPPPLCRCLRRSRRSLAVIILPYFAML